MQSVHAQQTQKIRSIHLLTEELVRRGYTWRDFDLSTGLREFTAPNGWTWLTRRALISYPFMPLTATYISTHKQLSYEFAAYHDVSTPISLVLPQDKARLAAFIKLYAPVIVKPANSMGGHGMLLGIEDIETAKQAVARARHYASEVLVQQQFMGDELRFTLLKGEIVSVILRETPRVIGDGTSSVAQLIQQENNIRQGLGFRYVPYPQLDATLIPEHFIHDERIPAKGEVVEFSKSTLVAGGGKMHDITAQVHASYIETAARLGNVLNRDFVTVDMLVKDFRKPQTDDNYVFLEFSTAPSLRLYYDVRSGNEFDIVTKLADMIDARSKMP